MTSHQFCTDLSAELGEPLEGWGGRETPQMFVHWPKGKWAFSPRIAKDMDDELSAALDEVVRVGRRRVGLIDRKLERVQENASVHAFLFPEGLEFSLNFFEFAGFSRAVARGEDLSRYGPLAYERKMVLCCTHSKHDQCCAKFGFETYQTLVEQSAERNEFDVWEATHLGGCRLASSVAVFPGFRRYGRLSPQDVAAFLDAEEQDLPYFPCFKGSAHLDHVEQVAEVTAMKLFETAQLDLIEEIESEMPSRAFLVHNEHQVAHIVCAQQEMERFSNCAAMQEGRAIHGHAPWIGHVQALLDVGSSALADLQALKLTRRAERSDHGIM